MAAKTLPRPPLLQTPTIIALKNGSTEEYRQHSRSSGMDMKAEQDELKFAAEQSLNVILDLGRDGCVRWVSPSWKEVVGTLPEDVKGKPVVDLLVSSKDAFKDAIESMRSDDTKSRIIRFNIAMGPHSVLREEPEEKEQQEEQTTVEGEATDKQSQEEQIISLKGQGILVNDRLNGEESHSMWMLRPSTTPKEITIDLPEILVESLGVGAEMLANYLTSLADSETGDPAVDPPPMPVMCRICECQITPWWFEKHTEGCTQEHRSESEVSMAHDRLTEHRHAIVSVLDALETEARQGRPPVSGESPPPSNKAEYKGFPIGPSKTLTPPASSLQGSPSRSRSREPSYGSIGHARSKSFAVRRPISKIVTLLMDLCDTALDISTPCIKPNDNAEDGSFRSQSPQSESRISQILGWQTPSVANSEDEQGLSTLIRDTENLVQAKVDAIVRYREVLEYTERIRVEFNALIVECTDAAIKKAESIKAGNISDSSSSSDTENESQAACASQDDYPVGSVEHVSSGGSQPRDTGSPSIISQFERRQSSAAASSTRSSSPLECPTPRSHIFGNPLSRSDSLSKRGSLLADSDTADSDSNMTRSAFIGSRRTESPEILARSASTNERKRRSLRLPHMPSPHRQPSPSRLPLAPASPLRIPKPRLPLGPEQMYHLPSPITSPPLSSTDTSSPLIPSQRHRRQSSAASSVADPSRPPPSPRLSAMSQPAARPPTTSIKDFEIIKPISKGAFGSVYLSKKKATGDYFAIKVLRKADMVAKNQVTNVKAERAIMMWQGESEFVAKLYWTFSSKDYLFLVMEYLNGGDCASLVKVLGNLPEDWTKKYIAEVVQGIEHLHSRGIVHRDIKPDNLLIDQKGHLKLTDFGLSRMGLIGRQKRALKSPNDSTPDLLKHGPFARATSIASSRSTSFDMQGIQGPSPGATPVMTPDLAGTLGQPSYFSLNRDTLLGREHSRRKSGYRSDSGNSDTFATMFRNFSLNDDRPRGERIEEEATSEHGESVDLYAPRPPSSSMSLGQPDTPPQSTMLPPPMALFDPEDSNRRFVGTPDYLAPETINGAGQDETSDWWSLGCILFEFLYGYPPFHAETPEKVFENILARRIDWPDEEESPASAEAKDLMSKLMTIDPKDRLGSNTGEKFASGGEQIRSHEWFKGIIWEALLEDEASFIPAPEHPEDTEYFDARGATLQSFNEEMEDQASSPALTPGVDLQDRPHDALSRVRSQVNSMKRGLMPLHIPPHVRDTRSRRLSEPVATDDFGNFAFKNLPVLEKANKDLLQKMRIEAALKQGKQSATSTAQSSATSATGPSLEGSPLLPMPLKRTLSSKRPDSPSGSFLPGASPNRLSQPNSPLVSFSTGQNHERRKTSSTSSSYSLQSGQSLQPGTVFEPPRLPTSQSTNMATSAASSPVRSSRHSLNMLISSPERTPATSRPQSMFIPSTSRARSHTVGSQDSETAPNRLISHNKRQSQVFDISPSSSDNEDPRTKALLRVQRRRQSSRRLSRIALGNDMPTFRPLDILVCEDHPVSRLVMEKLLEKLKCRSITVTNGHEAASFAMSEVQFDIILMEVKLPQMSGTDIARMVRDTKGANTHTPIIAVTGYLNELPQTHHFDALMEKPATAEKIIDILQKMCNWKPPGPNAEIPKQQPPYPKEVSPLQHIPSSLKRESRRSEDSPSSQSSGPFSHLPGLRKRSSREHSIGSSFFGDTDSTNTEDIPQLAARPSDDWAPQKGLGITKPIPILQHTTQEPAEMDPSSSSYGVQVPQLIHQNSAPPSIDIHTPRRQRSAEAIQAKRLDLERQRHECVESGDDEDEELGNVQVRARSPRGKHYSAKRSSKLGIEMMRTNSRGSIDESNPSPVTADLHPNPREERADLIASAIYELPPRRSASQQPPEIARTPSPGLMAAALNPPERFSAEDKGGAVRVIDMDATPKPPQTLPPSASHETVVQGEQVAKDADVELGLPIQLPATPATPTFPPSQVEG